MTVSSQTLSQYEQYYCKLLIDNFEMNLTKTVELSSTNRPREEFPSKAGSIITLGHFKNKDRKTEQYDYTQLVHSDSLSTIMQPKATQGLDQTRFHKGFYRRSYSDIFNEYYETDRKLREKYNTEKAEKSKVLNHTRQQALIAMDVRSGYNIISGEIKGSGPPVPRPEGIRYKGDGLGSEAPSRGKTILKESVGRYHAPLDSGKNLEYRQEVIYRNGLLQEQGCSVLQLGKKDMPSFGIEDQFSKSQYMNTSAVTQRGLIEAHEPGRFTPRKNPKNPSGRPEIVEHWNTKVDVFNKTSACRL